jgi:sugar lactone lactonase YvrE
VAAYPEGLGRRANDLCADPEGNIVTGTLNIEPAPGSTWRWSAADGWRLLDPTISNTNGPAVGVLGGRQTLVVGDTSGDYYAYDYEPADGTVGERRVFGDVSSLSGAPDGTTLDADGGLWCALYGGGQVVRFTVEGLDRQLPVPAASPTDVTFAGPALDRLYITTVSGDGPLDGALLSVDGLGPGRPEPRAVLGPRQ